MTVTSKEANRARYSEGLRADKYSRSRWRRELGDDLAAWSAAQIARYAGPSPRMLFVGGGVGYKDRRVGEAVPGSSVIGLDIGFTPLVERASVFGLPLNIQGDMEHLPVRTESMDAVCFFGALHHSAEPRRTLIETYRALKPGGCLVLTEPVSLKMLLQRRTFEPVGDNVNYKFSVRFLLDEVVAAGFTVRRHDTTHIAGRVLATVAGVNEGVLMAGLRIDRAIRWIPGAHLVGGVALVAATR